MTDIHTDMHTSEEALLARKTWRTLEPLHGMIYFVPEAAEAYAATGITGRSGYFASRAAPMGAVGAEVVIATFFNFNPALVRHAIPSAWDVATPAQLVAARFAAVDAAFRRILGDGVVNSADMARAAELARIAATKASDHTEGRPLAAAHAELAWPDEPHLVLWHAQSILREYRGDGHIAQLVVHGLSGLESLVTHAAAGDVPPNILLATRGLERGGLAPGGGRPAPEGLARAGRRAPLHADRHTAAPPDRGRHRRARRRPLRHPGRGALCRAAHPGPAVEQGLRRAPALTRR